MIASIGAGVFTIVLIFVALKIMTPIHSARIALIEALMALAFYTPYAIMKWPGVDVFVMHIGVYLILAYLLGVIGSRWEKRNRQDSFAKWFDWAPATIIIFFITLFTLDSFFVTIATQGLSPELAKVLLPQPQKNVQQVQSHFPGVVEGQKERKQHYDFARYQKKHNEQLALGWTINRGWLNIENPVVGEKAVFQVSVMNKQLQGVPNLKIKGKFLRLSNYKKDIEFEMQQIDTGIFQVPMQFQEPGSWHVYLFISDGKSVHETKASTYVSDTKGS